MNSKPLTPGPKDANPPADAASVASPNSAVIQSICHRQALQSLAESTQYIHPLVQHSDELLLAMLKDAPWIHMASRSIASYGVPYAGLKSYAISGETFVSPPLPDRLISICAQIQDRFGFKPNNCLINYYKDEKSKNGFHSDSTAEIAKGTGVVILSLGAERELSFRHVRDPDLSNGRLLQDGSLFYMTREMQSDWQHAILPYKAEVNPG